jgi:hypothetical protein
MKRIMQTITPAASLLGVTMILGALTAPTMRAGTFDTFTSLFNDVCTVDDAATTVTACGASGFTLTTLNWANSYFRIFEADGTTLSDVIYSDGEGGPLFVTPDDAGIINGVITTHNDITNSLVTEDGTSQSFTFGDFPVGFQGDVDSAATPEPATLLTVVAGGLVLGLRRRRSALPATRY